MEKRILIINLGSTSTKVAVYEDSTLLFQENVSHDQDDLKDFRWCTDQVDYRREAIMDVLAKRSFDLNQLDAICSRGGRIPPCKPGAVVVNQEMVDYFYNLPDNSHISGAGCIIAYQIAEPLNIPAYIYDPTSVDEMAPIARVSGLPEIPRFTVGHTLNTRAMAIKCAKEIIGKPFEDCTMIVAHIGGGSSVRLFYKGVCIDAINDDNGGFSPERTGGIAAVPLVQLCFSGKYTKEKLIKTIRGGGGLKANLGTSNALEIEKRIANGDEHAKLVYEAMAYGLAKDIGQMAVPVAGKVDRIILTGGVAKSAYITNYISDLVSFIAKVEIMPGENEIEALAAGALRVLQGEETARVFTI
ncbi:MAG: butyrate kinase [Mogibacterium sp.]|nr:butyrate kinase [Mogibacterium sp.]